MAKTCGALLLDWHVYALVGPFTALGLASAWRRGDGRAVRRCLTLGAAAVLFGSVVLGTNFAREHAALGGETPLAELPSVQSALYRTSIVWRGDFDWPRFVEQQLSRIGLASVPYAVSRFVVEGVEPPVAARYGTPSLVALSALLVVATLVLVVRPAARRRLPLAALALSGPCWAVTMRDGVSLSSSEFEGMFHAGVPLTLFALMLPRLDRLLRGRALHGAGGAVAAATFVLSGCFMARDVHDPERAERMRRRLADCDAIRGLAEGKTIVAMPGQSSCLHHLGAVTVRLDRKHLADFIVSDRIDGVRTLTPDNRLQFLYDRSVYDAFLTRYERRADRDAPSLQAPDYDVHLVRNEGEEGDELLYVRRECPATMNLRRWPRFFLHVRPDDANDLPADRRRHGFENRDFDDLHFWRRDGECYAVRPLPDYGIAGIRTGQFTMRRTREGFRPMPVWAGSFSPGDHDGAGGAPPR